MVHHFLEISKRNFRGQRIWDEVMRELLSKGLSHAKEAFLTGCSAGGLSTYIHCDDFRALVPKVSTIKCLADGGFFLDVYVLDLVLMSINR